MSTLSEFIEGVRDEVRTTRVGVNDLYQRYAALCDERDEPSFPIAKFGAALDEAGLVRVRDKQGMRVKVEGTADGGAVFDAFVTPRLWDVDNLDQYTWGIGDHGSPLRSIEGSFMHPETQRVERYYTAGLWDTYTAMCDEAGVEPMPQREFAARLRDLPGVKEVREEGGMRYRWVTAQPVKHIVASGRMEHQPSPLLRDYVSRMMAAVGYWSEAHEAWRAYEEGVTNAWYRAGMAHAKAHDCDLPDECLTDERFMEARPDIEALAVPEAPPPPAPARVLTPEEMARSEALLREFMSINMSDFTLG